MNPAVCIIIIAYTHICMITEIFLRVVFEINLCIHSCGRDFCFSQEESRYPYTYPCRWLNIYTASK